MKRGVLNYVSGACFTSCLGEEHFLYFGEINAAHQEPVRDGVKPEECQPSLLLPNAGRFPVSNLREL